MSRAAMVSQDLQGRARPWWTWDNNDGPIVAEIASMSPSEPQPEVRRTPFDSESIVLPVLSHSGTTLSRRPRPVLLDRARLFTCEGPRDLERPMPDWWPLGPGYPESLNRPAPRMLVQELGRESSLTTSRLKWALNELKSDPGYGTCLLIVIPGHRFYTDQVIPDNYWLLANSALAVSQDYTIYSPTSAQCPRIRLVVPGFNQKRVKEFSWDANGKFKLAI